MAIALFLDVLTVFVAYCFYGVMKDFIYGFCLIPVSANDILKKISLDSFKLRSHKRSCYQATVFISRIIFLLGHNDINYL